jgi:hypothetical protein
MVHRKLVDFAVLRACALRAPVFLCSLTCKKGAKHPHRSFAAPVLRENPRKNPNVTKKSAKVFQVDNATAGGAQN